MAYVPPPKHVSNEDAAAAAAAAIDNPPREFTRISVDIENGEPTLYGMPYNDPSTQPLNPQSHLRGFFPHRTPSTHHMPLFVNARISAFRGRNAVDFWSNNDAGDRLPVHLTVCQDVSGSLSGQKLEMCKRALNFVVDQLGCRDRFGLVTFGNRAREVVPLTKMTDGNNGGKEAARRSIFELQASGNTSLEAGLMISLRQEPFTILQQNTTTSPANSPKKVEQTLVLSHNLVKKNNTFNYTVNINPPKTCSYLEISCPEYPLEGNKHSVTASGEVELELSPLPGPISKLVITLFFDGKTPATTTTLQNNYGPTERDQAFRVVDYQVGDVLTKKQTIDLNKVLLQETQFLSQAASTSGSHPTRAIPPEDLRNVNRVILLFTDGNVNAGQVNGLKSQALEVIRQQERLKGVSPLLYTFGFGNETNASLLRDLANITHSNFYHINHADHIPRVFADVLGSVFSVVARNLRLRIRANPDYEVSIEKVYSGNFAQTVLAQKTIQTPDDDNANVNHLFASSSRRLRMSTAVTEVQVRIPNMLEDEYKDILVKCSVLDRHHREQQLRNPSHNDQPPPDVACRQGTTVFEGKQRSSSHVSRNAAFQQQPQIETFAPLEFFISYDDTLTKQSGIPETVHRSYINYYPNAPLSVRQQGNQHRNRFIEALCHRFYTQESLEQVRELADRGAMNEAQQHAASMCRNLEALLAEIKEEERKKLVLNPGSAVAAAIASGGGQTQVASNLLQLCLSQVNHVASTAVASNAEWTSNGGQQIVNSYASELGLQRNNNVFGIGGSGDVGERARSVFELNKSRKQLRAMVQDDNARY